ncbi:RluA family pseudouridine synthase [Parvibaculum sp.]|uniref:RluA family pseudouridine synthase n=1 Tax=Parvibaculum sp. TaxID=2024848 RepID=UPI00351DC3AF
MKNAPDLEDMHVVTVAAEAAGARLDKYLTDTLQDKEGSAAPSRARLRQLIEEGHVTLEGPGAGARPVAEPARRVKEGERWRVVLPPPVAAKPEGQAIPLEIVYEDDALIVVMKPAGLVVHPGPGNADMTLVNALVAHCGETLSGIGGERRPGIVHRLDKETSGLMVVAKTDRAHKGLSLQFAAHGRDGKLARAYTALTWGVPAPKRGTVDANIARAAHNRVKMATVTPRDAEQKNDKRGGRIAITHYAVKAAYAGGLVAQVECRLETGRTHQIRVHMTAIGHPLLGDPTYGTGMKSRKSKLSVDAQIALERLGRQALHAHHLGFEHPVTGEKMSFDAELPADMRALVEALEG